MNRLEENCIKIYEGTQIKKADCFTVENEPVASIELMERAAWASTQWLIEKFGSEKEFAIFCGTGNNGGDGMAITRLLINSGYQAKAYLVGETQNFSDDAFHNFQKLRQSFPSFIDILEDAKEFPVLGNNQIIIDAIFGTGLNRPILGKIASIIEKINNQQQQKIAIDIPSGLYADAFTPKENATIEADYTLSFQYPKLAFLLPESGKNVGNWCLLDIQLSKSFEILEPCNHFFISHLAVKNILKTRPKFSHKGTFGHGLLIAGNTGKMGAAVLAAKSFLRSGAGLLTVLCPDSERTIIQVSCQEAMSESIEKLDYSEFLNNLTIKKYHALAIGPGLGLTEKSALIVHHSIDLLDIPILLDADAITLLGQNKEWLKQLKANTILTPHPKEFERLVGTWENDFQRLELQIDFSKKYSVIIVLKGAHTSISLPNGKCFFNATGNSGLAKGGSGDTLTGIILGLLTQLYRPEEAAILGVYLHGLAGDIAQEKYTAYSMLPSDVIENLGEAYKLLIGSDSF